MSVVLLFQFFITYFVVSWTKFFCKYKFCWPLACVNWKSRSSTFNLPVINCQVRQIECHIKQKQTKNALAAGSLNDYISTWISNKPIVGNAWQKALSVRCSTPTSSRTLAAFLGRLRTLSLNEQCSASPLFRLLQKVAAARWCLSWW